MIEKRPSLRSLKAFEAFARTGSYTEAGRELNVTHSAVIQQVRSLEGFLRVRLIERPTGAGLLTKDGRKFAAKLGEAFEEIDQAVDHLLVKDEARPLAVTTTPSFASEWLLPRLQDFRNRHPRIHLEIRPTFEILPLNRNPIDIAIRYGRGNWDDGTSELLIRTPFVVAVSSSLIPKGATLREAEFSSLPWLQELNTNEVEAWFVSRGISVAAQPEVVHLPGSMILPTMRTGGGIACTSLALVEEDVRSGSVTILYSEGERRADQGYYVVRPRQPLRKAAQRFASWLLSVCN